MSQLVLVNAGAASVTFGVTRAQTWAVAAGGASFGIAMILLPVIILWFWRKGLNRRFRIVFLIYAGALASIMTGATLGTLIGTGAIDNGTVILSLRDAHMVVNVLGWVSLTIVGTFITFLPTVLRVRIPPWKPAPPAIALMVGVVLLATGLAFGSSLVAATGSVVFLAGALGFGALALQVFRTPRRHFIAVSAKHLLFSVVWFEAGAAVMAFHFIRGVVRDAVPSLADINETFFITFVCGWILQVLLGAWLYLLPAQHAGDPAHRKLLLAGVEHLATFEVVGINAGLALMALEVAGAPHAVAVLGAAFALAGGALALAKAWAYPSLANMKVTSNRAASLWGPASSA